eukprot:3786584-Amphidinium_carterae.1
MNRIWDTPRASAHGCGMEFTTAESQGGVPQCHRMPHLRSLPPRFSTFEREGSVQVEVHKPRNGG